MIRWTVRILVMGALVYLCVYAYLRVFEERNCYFTDKCEDCIRSLNVQLEFYSADKVLAAEKESGKPSERRAFYPVDLDELAKANKESAAYTTCPVYGVKYKYVQLDDGKSYLAYCPAQHEFHFESQSFVNAITPEGQRLHLFINGNKVNNLVGEHPNPWDFHTPTRVQSDPNPLASKDPTWAILTTDMATDSIQMLAQNPPRTSRW